MLTKALLAVRRVRGRIYPRYADPERDEDRELAETLIRLYQEHVGRQRGELEEALAALETHRNFKLIRGLAELLARRCVFALPADLTARPISPQELREQLFHQGYVTTSEARKTVLERVAQKLGIPREELEKLFWADREEAQMLTGFAPPSPIELLKQYNFELTQTLLFDCTELEFTVRGNLQEIFRQIKRLGLMYELLAPSSPASGGDSVNVRVTGPAAALGSGYSRYGMAFARLLPAIMRAQEWAVQAKIRAKGFLAMSTATTSSANALKGRELQYEFSLDSSRGRLLAPEPELEFGHESERQPEPGKVTVTVKARTRMAEQAERERFDSAVERDFAQRIRKIMPEWEVVHEPTVLKAGRYAFIPDFGFFLRRPGVQEPVKRLYLEIVGFWTEDYLRRKMAKLRALHTDVPLIIAVDRKLNCSAQDFLPSPSVTAETGAGTGAAAKRRKQVIFYEKRLPLEPVIQRLLELEEEQTAAELRAWISSGKSKKDKELDLPRKRVIRLQELAERYHVGLKTVRKLVERKLEMGAVGDYRLVGDWLVAFELLEELRVQIAALPALADGKGKDYFRVKELLEGYGLSPPEPVLQELGYRVEWHRLLPPDARVVRS